MMKATKVCLLAAGAMLLFSTAVWSKGSSDGAKAGDAKKSGTISFKIGHASPADGVFQVGMETFVKELDKRSNGTIKAQIYPSGQLGSLRELIESTQAGTLDVTVAASAFITNFCPQVSIFDLPFMFDNYEQAFAVMDGEVGSDLGKALDAKGLKLLGWWQVGFRDVTTQKNRKVNSLADLKGMRIRIMTSQLYKEMFGKLGCDPVPMDFSELFTALQQGTVDGQENPLVQILESKVYEVQKYVVETHHTYTPAGFMMSAKTWAKLTDEQKTIVMESAKVATDAARAEDIRRAGLARDQLTKFGIEFLKPNRDEFKAATKVVYDMHPELADLVKKANDAKAKVGK